MSKLDNITVDSSDSDIADAIIDHILNTHNPGGPFKLAYKFDANSGPPPVKCDRIVRDHTHCASEFQMKEKAALWLRAVLHAGLYVQRFVGKGYFEPIAGGSIKDVRESIAAQLRRLNYSAIPGDLDDEIPF